MTIANIFFIYGMCVMFYSMMAWLFLKKNSELLSRLVGVLMIVMSIQCIKDLFFIAPARDTVPVVWMTMTCVDMIAVPLYAFILIELCSPGTLRIKTIILHELPFVLLPALFILLHMPILYYANVAWAAVYGFGYAVWAVIAIPRYHRRLKKNFSFDENINLNWLRYILLSFFVILSLWIVDSLIINLDIEAVYMIGSLTIWMFISYFLYKHESVIDELSEPVAANEPVVTTEEPSGLKTRIVHLFENDKVYLNPQLRLSDVAAMVNSNRTYVSRIFNDNHGKTFFEFVNEYRVRHAMTLLKTSDNKLDDIAEQSGFNSRQSFHRVFSKIAGCSPTHYRQSVNG